MKNSINQQQAIIFIYLLVGIVGMVENRFLAAVDCCTDFVPVADCNSHCSDYYRTDCMDNMVAADMNLKLDSNVVIPDNYHSVVHTHFQCTMVDNGAVGIVADNGAVVLMADNGAVVLVADNGVVVIVAVEFDRKKDIHLVLMVSLPTVHHPLAQW